MNRIFAVKVYVDSVYQQFLTTDRVLAKNREEAEKKVIDYWKGNDETIIVKIWSVIDLGDFDKGEIILL